MMHHSRTCKQLHSATRAYSKPTSIRCQRDRSGTHARPSIAQSATGMEVAGPSFVVEVPPTRKSTLDPRAVPVVHSPSFFLQTEQESLLSEVVETRAGDEMDKESTKQEIGFEESPLEWMLESADALLNEMEKNPTETTRAIWEASNSPIGQGTAAGVRTAAKVTLKAGTEAVKMAVPVGTWALKEGFKTISKIMNTSSSKERK